MFRTIIAKAPDKRIQKIFTSNSNLDFDFFPCYRYEILTANKIFIKNIHDGYFDWIILTSYKAWDFFKKQLDDSSMHIPKRTNIAIFGPETAKRVVRSGGRANFTKDVKNSKHFALELVKKLEKGMKTAYATSMASDRGIEEIFLRSNQQIIRQNIYAPNSILDSYKIKEMIYDINPNAIVFLSSASATSFIKNCSDELLDRVKNIKLFAIGNQTASVLKKYTSREISIPDYPNIERLSRMIYDFAEKSKRE